jgi:hypothetical protein
MLCEILHTEAFEIKMKQINITMLVCDAKHTALCGERKTSKERLINNFVSLTASEIF